MKDAEGFIRQLAEDHQSGASEIVARVAEFLRTDIDEWSADLKKLAAFGLQCIGAQPSMAPLITLFNDLLWKIQESSSGPAGADQVLDSYTARPVFPALPADFCRPGSCVLTVSYSSSVLGVLRASKDRIDRVICLESRPLNEGRTMAEKLAESNIQVTVAVDAAVVEMAARADFAISGADCVYPDGLVNKQGTHMLALAARRMDKQVVAVVSESKLIGQDAAERFMEISDQNPNEVWASPPENISVENRYFESTPLDLFDSFFVDSKVVDQNQLLAELKRLRIHPLLTASK